MGGEPEIKIEKNSVLHLTLSGQINERSFDNPLSSFDFVSMSSESSMGLNDLVAALKHAKTDENIDGIYLDFGWYSGGFSTLKRLRDALIDFKESGKFIYCYQEVYSQRDYFLASTADSIFLNPTGGMEWRGIGTQVIYYTKALKQFGVEPQIIRGSNNKFKSAVEPYLTEQMSDANRLQLSTLLNDVWNFTTQAVGESRGISSQDLQDYANQAPMQTAKEALSKKLVDVVGYEDEFLAAYKARTHTEEDDDVKEVSFSRYLKTLPSNGTAKDKIAVIYAEGQIIDGHADDLQVDSDRFVKAIRKARTNDKIKAVVLRVNSPGGSALASDIIWRELTLLKKEKPLIVSMGDLAASGGYYISAPGDTVLAEPTTITGSIGVFGMFFTAGELLENKLGLVFEDVKTSKFADMPAMNRPLNEDEKNFYQKNVDRTYGKFLSRVVNGRSLDSLYVDSIGQGRVWTGSRAVELGLVDALGNLDDALSIAADKAGVEEYRLVEYPEFEDPIKRIIQELTGSQVKNELRGTPLEKSYDIYQKSKDMVKNQGVLMRMEYEIEL